MQTHLYRRAATYYWRRLVPTALQPILGARDLRASLRTNIPETARSRASRMDAAFDLAVEELESAVSSGQVISEAVKSCLIREFREGIIRKAKERRVMSGIRSPEATEAAVAKALNAQRTVTDLLKRNDLTRGKIEADHLLAREGIELDKSSFEYHSLASDLLGAIVVALDIVADLERGIPYDPDAPRVIKVSVPTAQSNGILRDEQVEEDTKNLTTPFSLHAAALIAKKEAANHWSTGHIDDARKAFQLFGQIVGDKDIGQIKQAETHYYVRQLSRMPVGVGQQHPYIGLSALDAIKKADELEAERLERAEKRIKAEKIKGAAADRLRAEARVQRISVVSQIKYRDPCSAVFKHLQSILNVRYNNPFSGVRPKKNKKSDVRDEREKYSDAQVRRIFSSPIWTGCKSAHFFCIVGLCIVKNENYWVPVMAAVAGLRLEEICQLWLDDIVDCNGFWCLDIWEGPERQLKNGPSARRVPIPEILIKLGLLRYADKLRKAGEYRLFPTLERTKKVNKRTGLGKLGPSLTKSIGRYFRIHKLADLNQLFHSFRHTFASKLDELDVPSKAINDLMGHLQGGSESQRRYIKRDDLLKLKRYMDRVDFGFQLVEIGGEWHFAKASEAHPAGE